MKKKEFINVAVIGDMFDFHKFLDTMEFDKSNISYVDKKYKIGNIQYISVHSIDSARGIRFSGVIQGYALWNTYDRDKFDKFEELYRWVCVRNNIEE